MTYTKYLLFSILLVSPSMLLSQGMTRRVYRIGEVVCFWEPADERNRRAEDKVRLVGAQRKHCTLNGGHTDVQLVRVRQELWTRHTLHRCFSWYITQSHAGHMEWHAY